MLNNNRAKLYTIQNNSLKQSIDLKLVSKCTLVEGLSLLFCIASALYGYLKLPLPTYLIPIILTAVSVPITIICLYLIYRRIVNQKNQSCNAVLMSLSFLISFLFCIAGASMILNTFQQNFQVQMTNLKPSLCPSYTINISGVMNGNNYTACLCKNNVGYTLLEYQTTGSKCCDCPFSNECTNFDMNACLTNNKSNELLMNILICSVLSILGGIFQFSSWSFFIYRS